ncbi:MAG: hypothetical protein OEZ21_04950 [Candidatus Bathyarchaeota archaeon]|nr:hypothetical protein [Candidatus Bathyarchaeota archaeon]MDH5746289.1 hypothetical protein [Candidatus Bathyarchaeota archaeon]
MPISLALVTRFFQLLFNRQFTEAERELERLKQRMHETEWNQGYSRALHGMLIARKSNSDGYSLLSKLDLGDEKALLDYRREFLSHVRNKLHGNFDRGFFSAWADCMRVLSKMVVNNPGSKDSVSKKEEAKILDKDKSQVTMESFLKGTSA